MGSEILKDEEGRGWERLPGWCLEEGLWSEEGCVRAGAGTRQKGQEEHAHVSGKKQLFFVPLNSFSSILLK